MTNDDPLTRADLERELHYMQTQVEQHGFPGTRAVLAELERLHAENARLREAASRALDLIEQEMPEMPADLNTTRGQLRRALDAR